MQNFDAELYLVLNLLHLIPSFTTNPKFWKKKKKEKDKAALKMR